MTESWDFEKSVERHDNALERIANCMEYWVKRDMRECDAIVIGVSLDGIAGAISELATAVEYIANERSPDPENAPVRNKL